MDSDQYAPLNMDWDQNIHLRHKHVIGCLKAPRLYLAEIGGNAGWIGIVVPPVAQRVWHLNTIGVQCCISVLQVFKTGQKSWNKNTCKKKESKKRHKYVIYG